jgi:branched-chain amino acid transport system permease protein
MFSQQVLNGLALGGAYALFAVGFGIVFSTMQILNLAQGVYATWGAIVAYWVFDSTGVPFWIGCLAGAAAGALVAIGTDQLAFQPLRNRGGGQMRGAIITSIAMWIALRELASILTDSAPLGFPAESVPNGSFEIFGLSVLGTQAATIGLAILVTALIYLLLHHTRLGAAIRAIGFSRPAAAIAGVNPRTAIIAGAGISGIATGLAGVLYASNQSFSFNMGDALLLQGFAAVVIGGVGDVRASAAGGFVVGMIQVLSAQYISGTLQDAIVFGLLLVFLVARPRGLFGTADLVRA